MLAGYLRVGGRRSGHWQVEIQDPSSGQATAFDVVPDANHFDGDAEIFGYGFYRVSLSYLVVGRRVGVGAGVTSFAWGFGVGVLCFVLVMAARVSPFCTL